MEIKNSVALVDGRESRAWKSLHGGPTQAGATCRVYAGARHPGLITLSDSRVVPVSLDVTQENSVLAAAENCADVTLLINNAGIMKGSPMLAEGSEAAFRDEMEVNVFGVLRMVRTFAPLLARNGGGAIANILSVVS